MLSPSTVTAWSSMYLMYVDESGDCGLSGSPTSHFVLSGIVVHESQWRAFASQMLAFRRTLKAAYGLPVRSEIHAAHFIRKPPVAGMQPHVRLAILRNFLDEIAKQGYLSITNVAVEKAGKSPTYDVFEMAWKALFQRFQNTLQYGNFPGGHRNDHGIIFTDNTDGEKLTKLLRRMSVYNPVPNRIAFGPGYRVMPTLRIIEDPIPKDSADSYFIQAADVTAYFLTQRYAPNTLIRQNGARGYFRRLTPVLNVKAATAHPLGIVEL